MPYVLIVILIIVIILIIYILYEFYRNGYQLTDQTVYSLVDLNVPPVEIITTLDNPSSSRYAIAGWIYINSWNTTDHKPLVTKTPFTMSGNIFSDVNTNVDYCLYLDKTQPNLIFDMTSIQSSVPIKPIIVMPGFPLQRWTQFIISVDTQIIDIYINGKLVLSRKLEALPQNTNCGIIFGTATPMDIKIKHFQRWATSLDPQSAWDAYTATSRDI